MVEQLTVHAYITGKVQGVFFRNSAQEEAKKLKISGWIKNLADGRVELIASGNKTHIESFLEWLRQGPPAARVENVHWEQIPHQPVDIAEFLILRSS